MRSCTWIGCACCIRRSEACLPSLCYTLQGAFWLSTPQPSLLSALPFAFPARVRLASVSHFLLGGTWSLGWLIHFSLRSCRFVLSFVARSHSFDHWILSVFAQRTSYRGLPSNPIPSPLVVHWWSLYLWEVWRTRLVLLFVRRGVVRGENRRNQWCSFEAGSSSWTFHTRQSTACSASD